MIPLHVMSDRSIGEGVLSPRELVEHAAYRGLTTLALSDVDTLSGQVEFHAACRASGIKAITGLELRPPRAERRGRLVLLARNAQGYAELCRLIAPRRARSAGYEPVARLEPVPEHLFVLSDDPNAIAVLLARGLPRESLRILLPRPASDPIEDRRRIDGAAALGVRLVAELQHALATAADSALQQLVDSISSARAGRNAAVRAAPLAATTDIASWFHDAADAVHETKRIADACNLDFAALWPQSTRDPARLAAEHSTLVARCRARPLASPAHAARLHDELAVIAAAGVSGYFLHAAALGDEALRRGIGCIARGSAVSSLVVHLLGLSAIDPLRHGLLFERFLNRERVEPPDIDLDVAYDRRDELLSWAQDFFGAQRAFPLSALVRYGRVAAYRAALRAWRVPATLIAEVLARLPDDDVELTADDELLPRSLRKRQALIERLATKPHHFALHPTGLVTSSEGITDGVPMRRASKAGAMLEYDASALAALGVPKLDLLGNRHLTQLATVRELGAQLPVSSDARDPVVLALLHSAHTVGCFQIETPALRALLPKLPMQHADDLVLAVALVRPGPGSGAAKAELIARLHGERQAPALQPTFAAATRTTHGSLVYEEQLMRLVSAVLGSSLAEADTWRATLVREGDTPRLRASFLQRAVVTGVAPELAQQCWETVAAFAAYTFSRAHATSHARLAWQSAWLKTHAPLEHGCALLRHYGGAYPLRAIAAELVRNGTDVRAPSVNASELAHGIEGDAIRLGLEAIRHLRRATRLRLRAERLQGGLFQDLRDLFERVAMRPRERAVLIECGACDALAPLSVADFPFMHRRVLALLETGTFAGLRSSLEQRNATSQPVPDVRTTRYAALLRVQNELALLGMHPSAHPMQLLRGEAELVGCIPSDSIAGHVGKTVRFAGVVSAMRRVALGRNQVLQFVTLEDERGLLEACLPARVYRSLANPVRHPGPYLLEGEVSSDHGSLQLQVQHVIPFHRRRSR